MERVTTVVIADNTEEFCTGLSAALQQAGGFQVLGIAGDGEQAIRLSELCPTHLRQWKTE